MLDNNTVGERIKYLRLTRKMTREGKRLNKIDFLLNHLLFYEYPHPCYTKRRPIKMHNPRRR